MTTRPPQNMPPPGTRRHGAATTRGPPMLPPGMPVRAEVANKQTIHQQQRGPLPPSSSALHHHQHQQQQQQQQRMSMPPPRTANGHRTAPRAQHQPPSRPSFDPSLRDSTRFNSDAGSSRSGSTARDSWIQTPESQQQAKLQDVDSQFDQLLDNLQIAHSVREKFQTVSIDVKSNILTNSVQSNPNILNHLGLPVPAQSPKIKKRLSAPLLRKVKSSSSIGGGQQDASVGVGKTCNVHGDEFIIVASPTSPPFAQVPGPHRGQSFDIPQSRPSNGPRPISGAFGSSSASSAKGLGISMGEQPGSFISWLKSYKGTDLRMEVDRMKKLRMLLRHESTVWVQTFVEMGGYDLVLARLQDVLDIEWREEQHDDKMLYELLRCVKALTTTEIGKSAIRHHHPRPFLALSALLFSEKKPGDLSSRQLIIELWLYLFELFPPSTLANPQGQAQAESRPSSVRFDTPPPFPTVRVTEDVRKLLSPDMPDPTAEHHTFITSIHRPKPFKAWVGELSDICRDYFWIMCHGGNTLWALDQVDERSVEKPVAPGGATGGVEFEAMNYVTIHFKLLNALCRAQAAEDREKTTQLHFDLLTSGMDRILVTMRKASTTYYPTLHLELARYVELLRAASPSGKLPHLIDKMVGSPPEHLRRFDGLAFGAP